eukprot:PhM_4_TR4610/c0_g1_i1/m.95151
MNSLQHEQLLRDALDVIEPLTAQVRELRAENHRLKEQQIQQQQPSVVRSPTPAHRRPRNPHHTNNNNNVSCTCQCHKAKDELEATIIKLQQHIKLSAAERDEREAELMKILRTRSHDLDTMKQLRCEVADLRRELERTQASAVHSINTLSTSMLRWMGVVETAPTPAPMSPPAPPRKAERSALPDDESNVNVANVTDDKEKELSSPSSAQACLRQHVLDALYSKGRRPRTQTNNNNNNNNNGE